jgi:cation/acetate symporter
MIYETSLWPPSLSVVIFFSFVAVTLGLSFYLGAKAKSAAGYFAAGGGIHWFVNGIAFAGDYLSAASFLGICGMIAFYGYDGFLYSIGYLAGWVVALFVVAEPLKRMGKYTFADALDSRFQSRGIKLAVAISTLAVSIFYLIPQMVGAGTLIKPLLGFPHYVGVITVGAVVILIVVTAGMVSTTYVQFIKGSLLVFFSTVLVVMILNRGLNVVDHRDVVVIQRVVNHPSGERTYYVCRGEFDFMLVPALNSLNPSNQSPRLEPVGHVASLPGGAEWIRPLGPVEFLRTIQESKIVLWKSESLKTSRGTNDTVYVASVTTGSDVLRPGNHPTFKGIRSDKLTDKLNFLSLMLALFGGTASLPHILIRYYTVKDQASARKSTIVGIASIGFFYVLTLYIGLGAMTSGALDVTNSNMAAPLLARSFGEWLFAIISAIAFTTVLGTVSGLIVAAAGAVVHDIMSSFLRLDLSDHEKIRCAKLASIVVGGIAIVLGILFEKMNVSYLVGWAFSVAASANLPSLVMLLFWRGTTKQGIIAAVSVGMVTSLGWILLSADTFKDVYGLDPAKALVPFSQPGIVTIPLGFAVLVGVSLLTRQRRAPVAGQRLVGMKYPISNTQCSTPK